MPYNQGVAFKYVNDVATSDDRTFIRLNENIEIYSNRLQELQEERRRESEQYYEETGKIDSFMWAEIEHKKYEEYYEKLERQWAKEEEELEDDDEVIEEILNYLLGKGVIL